MAEKKVTKKDAAQKTAKKDAGIAPNMQRKRRNLALVSLSATVERTLQVQ